MKTVFLTSSPTGSLDGQYRVQGLDEANGFRANLKKVWKAPGRCLMIAADPYNYGSNDEMTDFFCRMSRESGLPVECFDLLDERWDLSGGLELSRYQVIFLAGGHVPTQNAFFHRIGLAAAIRNFDGVVIGISAGSMNSAGVVYCQPEEQGEAVDPFFRRWIPGLGLTHTMIIPHYQMVKDRFLDGMSLYGEITRGDSYGNRFLLLNDGSYLLCGPAGEFVFGESYVFSDGGILPFTGPGEWKLWETR